MQSTFFSFSVQPCCVLLSLICGFVGLTVPLAITAPHRCDVLSVTALQARAQLPKSCSAKQVDRSCRAGRAFWCEVRKGRQCVFLLQTVVRVLLPQQHAPLVLLLLTSLSCGVVSCRAVSCAFVLVVKQGVANPFVEVSFTLPKETDASTGVPMPTDPNAIAVGQVVQAQVQSKTAGRPRTVPVVPRLRLVRVLVVTRRE